MADEALQSSTALAATAVMTTTTSAVSDDVSVARTGMRVASSTMARVVDASETKRDNRRRLYASRSAPETMMASRKEPFTIAWKDHVRLVPKC